MPSPFPGMDPYLEAHWRDVHASLIIYSRDALQGVLPGELRARVEERVLLEMPTGFGRHAWLPDVRIVEHAPRPSAAAVAGTVAMTEPIVLEVEPMTETFIEIIDAESGNRVVTVIEFLSPSNKVRGPNQDQYLRKQGEICASATNLVEVDLNRYGTPTLACPSAQLEVAGQTPYMGCVRRAARKRKVEFYPMPLAARLPVMKIPLRRDDADVPLDLQALVDQCYRNGGYDGTLNYTAEPDPPLIGADKNWADGLLTEKGLRKRKRTASRKGKGKSR